MIQLDRTSGTYQIDRELLDALAVDGWVLMAQDSARLSEQADGYFQLDGVTPDDLAALLGLRDGDVPLEVNGFPLKSWDGYATALTQLTSETAFVVAIERDDQTIELRYEVLLSRSPPRGLLALVLGAVAITGCREWSPPPIRYRTDRAVIGTGFDDPLCGADLTFIDRHIGFVESMLDVRHEETVEIYLFDELDELPCEQPAFGCFDEEDGYVAAVWDAVDHEIVHALTPSVPYPSLFWEEGVAGALSVEGTHKNPLRELRVAELDARQDVDYSSAAHFVRFLLETRGEMAVARAIDGEDLVTALGADASALVAEYESEVPYAYPPWEPCPYPEIPEKSTGVWGEELSFSCESPDASQFEWAGANVVRRLTLAEAGAYEVTVTGC